MATGGFSSGASPLTNLDPGATNSPTVTPMIANLGSQATTQNQYDPRIQNFINGLLGQSAQNMQSFNVPEYTQQALQNLTQNPGSVGDLAGKNMQQIINPLLQQQQQGFKIQQANLSDMFRKAGVGTQQSGAFAQAARQLVNDQGQQQQNIIASNYVPLLQNAQQTQQQAINAGIAMPGGQAAGQASLNTLLGTLYNKPTATTTSGVQQNLVQGGVATAR